jgi:hypothetical protein
VPLWQEQGCAGDPLPEGRARRGTGDGGQGRLKLPRAAGGIAERPRGGLCHVFLASALALDGRKNEARQTISDCERAYPSVRVAITSGWPFEAGFLDRVAEGLESAGLRDPA